MPRISSLADVKWNGGVSSKIDRAAWQSRAEAVAGAAMNRLTWQTPEAIPVPP